MLTVTDRVCIKAPVDVISEWLRDMPRHYWEWHPRDHKAFRIISGPVPLAEGSVARAKETIGAFRLAFTFVITRVVSNELLEWRATFPYSLIRLHGSFAIKPLDSNETELIAVTAYGAKTGIFSPVVDWLADKIVPRDLVAAHMMEEGLNVKRAVEKE